MSAAPQLGAECVFDKAELGDGELAVPAVRTSPRTGLVYDERLLAHKNPWCENSECPERLSDCYTLLRERGLAQRCQLLPCVELSLEDAALCHSDKYLAQFAATEEAEEEGLLQFSRMCETYTCKSTWRCALLSAGGAVSLTRQVLKGELDNGFALIRPPGHHAGRHRGDGYCFLNNAAIAARVARQDAACQRVLIVDFDVHHGQGTQDTFISDPSVLYFSTHRHEFGYCWPHLRRSHWDEVGSGAGRGFNINCPIQAPGLRDSDLIAIWLNVLLPIAHEFSPSLIIVSAGYDAAIGDGEGESELTPALYAHLVALLQPLAPIVCILEGGYFRPSLAASVSETVAVLLGDPPPPLLHTSLSPAVRQLLPELRRHLSPFWVCLRDTPSTSVTPTSASSSPAYNSIMTKLHERQSQLQSPPWYPEEDTGVVDEEKMRNDTAKVARWTAARRNTSFGTAYAYDPLVENHQGPSQHPENPSRTRVAHSTLDTRGLLTLLHRVQARDATVEELCRFHDEKFVRFILETLPQLSPAQVSGWTAAQDSLFFCPATPRAATLSAGLLLQCVDEVVSGRRRNAIALIRPPGHHAETARARGFCYFNNVGVAAKHARAAGVGRVLCLDWDVHHGNGIQDGFYDDESVLYISLHRHEDARFYPCQDSQSIHYAGLGRAAGRNINIPWQTTRVGAADYQAAFIRIVLPVAYEFQPDLVLVSAGFDAAAGDPLGNMSLLPSDFALFTHWLSLLAGGRVVLALEGGYNIARVADCVAACTEVLLGVPGAVPRPTTALPTPEGQRVINEVLVMQSFYWDSLTPDDALPAQSISRPDGDVARSTASAERSSVADVTVDNASVAGTMADFAKLTTW